MWKIKVTTSPLSGHLLLFIYATFCLGTTESGESVRELGLSGSDQWKRTKLLTSEQTNACNLDRDQSSELQYIFKKYMCVWNILNILNEYFSAIKTLIQAKSRMTTASVLPDSHLSNIQGLSFSQSKYLRWNVTLNVFGLV